MVLYKLKNFTQLFLAIIIYFYYDSSTCEAAPNIKYIIHTNSSRSPIGPQVRITPKQNWQQGNIIKNNNPPLYVQKYVNAPIKTLETRPYEGINLEKLLQSDTFFSFLKELQLDFNPYQNTSELIKNYNKAFITILNIKDKYFDFIKSYKKMYELYQKAIRERLSTNTIAAKKAVIENNQFEKKKIFSPFVINQPIPIKEKLITTKKDTEINTKKNDGEDLERKKIFSEFLKKQTINETKAEKKIITTDQTEEVIKIYKTNKIFQLIQKKYESKKLPSTLYCDAQEIVQFLEKNKTYLLVDHYYKKGDILNGNQKLTIPCDLQFLNENKSIIIYPSNQEYATGGFKKVFLGVNYDIMDLVVKQVISTKNNPHLKMIEQEVALSKKFKNERGIAPEMLLTKQTQRNEWVIIQKYLGDELLNDKIANNDEDKYKIVLDILYGLDKIHKNNIIHHDIKPENILVFNKEGKNEAFIVDFGLFVQKNQPTYRRGTLLFLPPEELLKEKSHLPLESTDIWGTGLSLLSVFKKTDIEKNLINYSKLNKIECTKAISQIKDFQKFDEVFGLTCKSHAPKYILNGLEISHTLENLACAMVNPDKNLRITAPQALKVMTEMCQSYKDAHPNSKLNCHV